MFYREVVYLVLLFDLGYWFLLAAVGRSVEGTHTRFLRKIMGKRARRKADGAWCAPRAEEVREASGTQSATKYIV